jgi:hypothetical protein
VWMCVCVCVCVCDRSDKFQMSLKQLIQTFLLLQVAKKIIFDVPSLILILIFLGTG